MIYLDNAATTKMSLCAINAYELASKEFWGNVSSQHDFGKSSNKLLNYAIDTICNIINCKSNELIFTSGATEGNNMVINNINNFIISKDDVIITSQMEHNSILNSLKYMAKGKVMFVKPDEYGIIDPNEIESIIKSYNVRFVTIQLVNNEIGVIQQIKKISEICHKYNVLIHTDATQAMGHLHIDVKDLGIDYLTASAHKFNGPKGVGFLYINENVNLIKPLIYGGHQQNNIRAGTINLPGIYSMAIALANNNNSIDYNFKLCSTFREYIINRLRDYNTFQINGSILWSNRMTNNLNFYIRRVDVETILDEFSKNQIYASTGSACNLGYNEFSNTLLAMNKTKWIAKNSIRLTFDPEVNDMQQIKFVTDVLESIIK